MSEEELRKEIEDLKRQNEILRQKITILRKQLEGHTKRAAQDYRNQQDYLPYDDDDRR